MPKKKSGEGSSPSYPLLEAVEQALKPTWQEAHLAGRVLRHTDILRGLARRLDANPDREARPQDAKTARRQYNRHLKKLQREAPRSGLGAGTGEFVDRLAAITARYGAHLFVCFSDARIPATTNGLEGAFGEVKRNERRALGRGSTTNSVVQNLGADYLMGFAWRQRCGPSPPWSVEGPAVTATQFLEARKQLAEAERDAIHRRSVVRNFEVQLSVLQTRWHHPD